MLKGRSDRAAALVLPVLIALIAAILLAGAALPGAPRAFQALVFVAMLAALWGAGSRLARRLAPDFGPESHAVAAFTFAVGIAVVPATWLGHFGWLRPAPFLAWTAAAFLLSRLLPAGHRIPAESESINLSRRVRIETALLIAAALAIAFFNLHDLIRLRFAPAGAYGFDDVSYHLSTVATWIRYGDLRMIRFSMGDPSTPFYPVLGEMASWVLIAPFRDSDVAARWTQLPFALFSFLAVAAIARRLGLSRRDAALAAIAYGGIHHVLPVLAVGAGNDHSTAFFTLAGVDGALALARRPRPGAAVATGAALGLLLATKYIGILYAPVVLALLVLAVWIQRRSADGERIPMRNLAGLAVLLAAVIAVTGGYTYLRNAMTTGNPIFPAPVEILGTEVFPGWGGVAPLERDTSPEFRIDVVRFLTRRAGLFGSWFPLTLLPAALLAPFLALWRRRWPAALTFSLPAIFFLQFLLLMHDHRDIRYFLPAIALAAVAFAWLLAELGPRAFFPRALLLVWITSQAFRYLDWKEGWRILAAVAMLGLGALGEIAWNAWRRRREPDLERWGWIAAVALVLAAAVPMGRLTTLYQEKKLSNLPGPLVLERLAGPNGARVAYAGMNQPYLFFGSRFQNDLEIVPRNQNLDARYYRWGSDLGHPYDVTSYRPWRRSLERLGIAFVVIVRSPWENPERRWVTRRSDEFALAWADPEVEIWRLVTPPPDDGPDGRGYNPRDAEPAAKPEDHRR
jgi:hypothetical protein